MYSPVPGARMTTPYGRYGRLWSSGRHTGADYAAPHGSLVRAVAPGQVLSAGEAGLYGNLVRVLHDDGTIGYYAHLSRFATRPGQRVQRGTWLGNVGSSGNTTGPHLHFEVRRAGRSVNPIGWLTADYAEVPGPGDTNTVSVRYRDDVVMDTPEPPEIPSRSTAGGGFLGTEFDIDEQLDTELPAATGGR